MMAPIRAGYKIIVFPEVSVFHQVAHHGRVRASTYFHKQIRNWIWIFYRYCPFVARWWKVALYIAVYVVKGILNFRLLDYLAGILAGVTRIRIIWQYREKLSNEEIRLLDSLNRRRSLHIDRGGSRFLAASQQPGAG